MVYTLSAVGFFVGILVKTYLMVHFTLKSSSHLHDKVFQKVCRAPMAFFDTTPTGRILNRFSKDLDEIDIHLPFNVDASSLNIVRIFISIGMIATVFPWFLMGLAPLVVVFLLINVVFNRSSRQLKRMDGITRSPMYSHLTATVQGLSTLHAYNKMNEFNAVFKRYLDQNTRPFFMFFCAQRWLAVRLDMLTICIVCIAGLMVVLIKGTLPPAFLGLVLTYSLRVRKLKINIIVTCDNSFDTHPKKLQKIKPEGRIWRWMGSGPDQNVGTKPHVERETNLMGSLLTVVVSGRNGLRRSTMLPRSLWPGSP